MLCLNNVYIFFFLVSQYFSLKQKLKFQSDNRRLECNMRTSDEFNKNVRQLVDVVLMQEQIVRNNSNDINVK